MAGICGISWFVSSEPLDKAMFPKKLVIKDHDNDIMWAVEKNYTT